MSTSTSPIGSQITSAAAGSSSFNAQQYVASIISAESAPEQLMQQQVSTLSSQASALGTINTQLMSLQTAVFALNDFQGALAAKVANSSDSSVATATATSLATAGSHTLTVANLATTSTDYTNTLADGNTTFTTGSFSLQVGSNTPVNVTVDSTDNTLNGLATAINTLGAGVTASVVTDANGARLAMVSNTSGAPGNITVSSNTTGLSFTQAVAGANANFTLDGISLSSTSNAASGVLPGVSLQLNNTTTSPVTITVAPDTQQATTAINSFISAYNTVIGSVNQQFTYDPTTQSTGPLGSDTTLMQIQQNLLGDAAFTVAGNSGYTNLASIGITMNEDGTLALDQPTLNAAMTSNYSAVQNLFQQITPPGVAQQFNNDLLNVTAPGVGPIATDQTGIQSEISDLNQQISDFQANLNAQQQQLLQTYSQVAVTLQQMPTTLSQLQSQLASLP
jgi:flagellar hook-associated protein 2